MCNPYFSHYLYSSAARIIRLDTNSTIPQHCLTNVSIPIHRQWALECAAPLVGFGVLRIIFYFITFLRISRACFAHNFLLIIRVDDSNEHRYVECQVRVWFPVLFPFLPQKHTTVSFSGSLFAQRTNRTMPPSVNGCSFIGLLSDFPGRI